MFEASAAGVPRDGSPAPGTKPPTYFDYTAHGKGQLRKARFLLALAGLGLPGFEGGFQLAPRALFVVQLHALEAGFEVGRTGA